MKLGSFRVQGRDAFGIIRDDGVVDLSQRTGARSLRALLEDGLASVARYEDVPTEYATDEIEWLPPITDPMHIIGIGLNTRSHFEETAQLMKRVAGDYPKYPRLFMRSPNSLVGHQDSLIVPAVSDQLDYEGEIVLVIGKRCRNVSEEQALGHILGITAANDGSMRDYQFHSTQVTAGKNFHASGAIGPWIMTTDEIGDLGGLTLITRVNGEVRQQLTMEDVLFSFAYLISYISEIYQLEVGDIILTGSPAGIGGLDGKWLRPGDDVEIEIPRVAILRNKVAKAA
jgi:2-keto-4-pentenoate hydratase/2-oxohepta-3-ene-1,7-dioic acid hydratase in catechol pathway